MLQEEELDDLTMYDKINVKQEIGGQSPCCCESLVPYKVQDVFEDWVAILDGGGHAGLFYGSTGQEA